MLRKLSAIRSQSRPHRKSSLIMFAHGELDLVLIIIITIIIIIIIIIKCHSVHH